MTVTIELPPDIEAGLLAQAQTEGLDVADYVRKLVWKELAANFRAGSQPVLPAQQKKSLSELFSILHDVDIDFSRNPSTGRAINL